MAERTYVLHIVPMGSVAEGWTDDDYQIACDAGWMMDCRSDLVLLEVEAADDGGCTEREIDRKEFGTGYAASAYLAAWLHRSMGGRQ